MHSLPEVGRTECTAPSGLPQSRPEPCIEGLAVPCALSALCVDPLCCARLLPLHLGLDYCHGTYASCPGLPGAGSLDLSASRWLAIIFNVLRFFLFLSLGRCSCSSWLGCGRKQPAWAEPAIQQRRPTALSLLVIVLVVAGQWCYEAVHGLFFWLFTGTGPSFAAPALCLGGSAGGICPAASTWLGVAPLVVITVWDHRARGGTFRTAVPPIFVLAQNAGGSIGDLIAAAWLLTQPKTCLANDQGNKITLNPRT